MTAFRTVTFRLPRCQPSIPVATAGTACPQFQCYGGRDSGCFPDPADSLPDPVWGL